MSREHGPTQPIYDLSRHQERGEAEVSYRFPLGKEGHIRYISGGPARLLAELSNKPVVGVHSIIDRWDMPREALRKLKDKTKDVLLGTPYALETPVGMVGLSSRSEDIMRADIEGFTSYRFRNGTEVLLPPQAHQFLTVIPTDELISGRDVSIMLGIPRPTLSDIAYYLKTVVPPESGVQLVSRQGSASHAGYFLQAR